MKRALYLLGILLGVVTDATAALPTNSATFKLDELLAREDLWTLTPTNLAPAVRGGGFFWLDAQQTAVRGGQWVALRFLDLPIWEALFQFESNHVGRVDLSFYNRGDAGDLSATAFSNLLNKVTKALSSWTESAAMPLPELAGAAHVKIQRASWTGPSTLSELEWSVTKPRIQNAKTIDYRSEFIRLKLLPAAAATKAPARSIAAKLITAQTIFELRKRVQVSDDGDALIPDVPMVNQGFKGYCAAAVTARVMRYYGMDFDQHDAAQVEGTSATEGTKGSSLKDSLRRIAQNNGLQFFSVQDADYQRMVSDYNVAAVAAHKPKVSLSGMKYNLDSLFAAVDRELLRQTRGKKMADLTRFRSDVAKNIDVGVPLIWDVYLGLVPETPALFMGGAHLRLIIGYNRRTGDILYTDTWGRGHECKRMSLADAMTITLGLYAIKPGNA